MALCGMLAFYTGNDTDRIDRLFRQSGLFRPKWDERHSSDGATYGQVTVAKAATNPVVYKPPSGRGPTTKPSSARQAAASLLVSPALLNLTDLGNAERLVARHGHDLHYVHLWGKWLVWDGHRWRPDDTGEVERRAKETVRAMYTEATEIPDEGDRKNLAEHAIASESEKHIKSMIALARSEPEIPVTPLDLDADPWLLNTLNGTIDLRTGRLRPHDRADLITKIAPVQYDPDARLDLWDEFIETMTDGDAAQAGFLQRATGYSLTGDTREEKIFMGIGPGATGKSTFAEAVKSALGDYAMTADFETFLARRDSGGPRNDIARLRGARFVVSIEVDKGKRLADGLIKMITGGDTVAARFLYAESFEFRPAFKLWLMANHAPNVRDDDDAMWRRLLQVPFRHVVPKADRDPNFKATLRDPRVAGPAILVWAVKGCMQWQKDGLGVPPVVEMATEEYRADMDPLKDFYADRCVFSEVAWVASADVWKAYTDWANEAGERHPINRKDFCDRLKARGGTPDPRTLNGKKTRGWEGVGLGSDDDDHEDAEERTAGHGTRRDAGLGKVGQNLPHEGDLPNPVAQASLVSPPPQASPRENDPPLRHVDNDEKRPWVLAKGESLGWPRLDIGRGESIAPGEAAWRTFCAKCSDDQLARVVAALLAWQAS